MLSLPTAILLAGIVVGIGFPVGLLGITYILYRLILHLAIFKVAENSREAAFLRRQFVDGPPKPQKVVAEMPDREIASLADNPEVLENMRKKQTSTPPDNY